MRTNKKIQKEIEALKAIRPRVVPYSIFGDNNIAKLDAMVKVLEERMDEDDIEDEFGTGGDNEDSGNPENGEYESARQALDWLEGEEESLTNGWPIKKEYFEEN